MRRFPLFGEEAKPDSSVNKILEGAQDRQLTELTATPSLNDFSPGESKLFFTGGALRLYTRRRDADSLWYVTLTAA